VIEVDIDIKFAHFEYDHIVLTLIGFYNSYHARLWFLASSEETQMFDR
jgi:hypothetical protein